MKKLLLLSTVLLGMVTASHAGVRVNIGIPFPAPVVVAPAPPVYYAPAPIYAPPPPVYVPAPVVVAPPPVVVVPPPVRYGYPAYWHGGYYHSGYPGYPGYPGRFHHW